MWARISGDRGNWRAHMSSSRMQKRGDFECSCCTHVECVPGHLHEVEIMEPLAHHAGQRSLPPPIFQTHALQREDLLWGDPTEATQRQAEYQPLCLRDYGPTGLKAPRDWPATEGRRSFRSHDERFVAIKSRGELAVAEHNPTDHVILAIANRPEVHVGTIVRNYNNLIINNIQIMCILFKT